MSTADRAMSVDRETRRQVIRPHPRKPITDVEAAILEAHLRREIKGEVRFDDGNRALYATDGSNYRQGAVRK